MIQNERELAFPTTLELLERTHFKNSYMMVDTTPGITGDVRCWLALRRIEQEETAHHIDPETTQPRTKRQKSDSSEEQSCPQPQMSEEETLSDAASKQVLKYLSKG